VTRPALRLLHTSDLHIGGEYGKVGDAWHGPRCVCPVELVTRGARVAGADVLLVAGDMFDNARIDDEIVVAVMRIFGRQPFRTVILPGNHDPHDERSIYLRGAVNELPASISIFREGAGELIRIPALGLSLWGRPTIVHDSSHRPLFGAPPRPNGDWFVVTAHGDLEDDMGRPSSPIHPDELAAVEADYIALGHWDTPASVGLQQVPTWYSGSPCIGGVARTALLVTMNGGTTVHPFQLESRTRVSCPGVDITEEDD
jgi:DNA repair exonuclease SbcCD nuclease subunit